MTRPPSMGPKVGVKPNKPGFRPVENRGPQVEVERIDPQKILSAAGAPVRKTPEQEILENAEEFDIRQVPVRELVEARKEREKEVGPPPVLAEEAPSPVDQVVTDDLVLQLMREYSLDTTTLHEVELPIGKKTLKLHVRLPEYEDAMWILAIMARRMREGEDASLMMDEVQREEMTKQFLATRCVLKIDGHWIWDVFKAVPAIKQVNPAWDGQDPAGVPDFMYGTMTVQVYGLLRRMDPNLLFRLGEKFEDLHDGARGLLEEAEKNPTHAT